MGVTLAKIAANTANVKIPVGDDTVTVIYYPGRITEQIYADCAVLADPANVDVAANAHATNDVLVKLVKSWDLLDIVLDDKGEPVLDEESGEPKTVMFPITMERLPEVPYEFRMEVYNAIFEDIRPKNASVSSTTLSSAPSDAGSSSMA